jgi:hypothetical protein
VGSYKEDYAILSLQSPLPESLEPVPLLDEAYPNELFRAAGYPRSIHEPDNPDKKNEDIDWIGGRVRAADTSMFGGTPAIQLYSDEGAAGLSLHGMSGGPVLVGQNPEGAVGLVRWNNPRKDAPELGVGGSFWACPLKLIVEKHSEDTDLVLHVRRPTAADRFSEAATARITEDQLAARLRRRYQSPDYAMIERISSRPLPIKDAFVNLASYNQRAKRD